MGNVYTYSLCTGSIGAVGGNVIATQVTVPVVNTVPVVTAPVVVPQVVPQVVNTAPVVVPQVTTPVVSYALNYIGENPSSLTYCQGDCDKDSDCPSGSECVKRNNGNPAIVAGCSTGDGLSRPNTDYCTGVANIGTNGYTTTDSGYRTRTTGTVLGLLLVLASGSVIG